MPTQKNYILWFNQFNQFRSDKAPCIIYADLEPLIKKIDYWKNNPEKSSTTKLGEYILCGSSISTIWVFDNIKNKYNLYRGGDCMKKVCITLREHAAMKLILKITKYCRWQKKS